MDLFGDEIDSILGNDDLNKNVVSDGEGDGNENDENSEEKEEGASKTVDPKRRAVRKPQLRLNVERLIDGERGIHTLEKYYQGIKYRGKGHEKDDLDNVLKRMEHWAHRLYPKYTLKDFLTTTEHLGKKKQLQTHMNRYRQGMLELVVEQRVSEDEQEEVVDQPFDDIDELLGQQIEKYKTAPSASKTHNATFDSMMRSSIITTPRFMGRNPIEASTPMSPMGCRPLDTTLEPEPSQPPQPTLTAEQKAMIAENRIKALERLKARREALENSNAAAMTLSTTNQDLAK